MFFKHTCNVSTGPVKKWTGWSLNILIHLLKKLLNASANKNVLLWMYKS